MTHDFEIVMLHGIPASGKTTKAHKMRQHYGTYLCKPYHIIERDAVRVEIMRERWVGCVYGRPDWDEWKFNKSNEGEVTNRIMKEIEHAINIKSDGVIISDTNLNIGRYENFINQIIADYCQGMDVKVTHEIIFCSYDEALKRDAHRPMGVGQSVIYSMYQQFLKNVKEWYDAGLFELDDIDDPTLRNVVQARLTTHKTDLPEAVIVDVDGTIASMFDSKGTRMRSPYDWDKVKNDMVRYDVINMIDSYVETKHIDNIIIVTGRDGVALDDTKYWLDEIVRLDYTDIHIRPVGDIRKDTVIKSEIYLNEIIGKYSIKAVFDDRPSVCRMWRDMGLEVFQMADPYHEF